MALKILISNVYLPCVGIARPGQKGWRFKGALKPFACLSVCVVDGNCLPFSTVIQPPKCSVRDLCVLSLLSGGWEMCCWIQGMDFIGQTPRFPSRSHPRTFKWLFNFCVCAICLLVLFVFFFYRFGISGRFIKDDIKSSQDH